MGKRLFSFFLWSKSPPQVHGGKWWGLMGYVVSPHLLFYSETTYQSADGNFFIFIRVLQNSNEIHITVLCWRQRCSGEGSLGDSFTITCWCGDARSPDLPAGGLLTCVVKSVALKNMLTRLPRSRCSAWHIKAAHKWNCWSCGGAVLTFRQERCRMAWQSEKKKSLLIGWQRIKERPEQQQQHA